MEDAFERRMKTVRGRAVKAVLCQSGAVWHEEENVELEVEDKDGKYLCFPRTVCVRLCKMENTGSFRNRAPAFDCHRRYANLTGNIIVIHHLPAVQRTDLNRFAENVQKSQ